MLKWLVGRHRLLAFLVFGVSLVVPPYTEKLGWVVSERVPEVVLLVLRSALIKHLVFAVWPSLALHVLAYWLLYRLAKAGSRGFVAFSGLLYLAIAVGQGSAVTEYGFSILASNVILILAIGVLWLRDYRDKVSLEGRGPAWLLPLTLFAFIAPMPLPGSTPWAWMWKSTEASPITALSALAMDALAGHGVVAYCLFTPLALYSAAKTGALRPLTIRLTSLPGIFYALVVIASAAATPDFGSVWSAALHIPLLVTNTYYFLARLSAE